MEDGQFPPVSYGASYSPHHNFVRSESSSWYFRAFHGCRRDIRTNGRYTRQGYLQVSLLIVI